jgi:hypothetical protein
MIDIDAAPAAPRPRFEIDGAQVAHVVRTDDVETFAADPAQIGRVLFGGKFLRQLFRDDGILGHGLLLPGVANQQSVIRKDRAHPGCC